MEVLIFACQVIAKAEAQIPKGLNPDLVEEAKYCASMCSQFPFVLPFFWKFSLSTIYPWSVTTDCFTPLNS